MKSLTIHSILLCTGLTFGIGVAYLSQKHDNDLLLINTNSTNLINGKKKLTNQDIDNNAESSLDYFLNQPSVLNNCKKIKGYIDSLTPDQLKNEIHRLHSLQNERDGHYSSHYLILSEMLYQRWGEISPTHALENFDEQATFSLKNHFQKCIFEGWASYDPENAANYIINQDHILDYDLDAFNINLQTIVRLWAKDNAQKAFQWFMDRPKSEQSVNLYEPIANIMEQYARQNPQQALKDISQFIEKNKADHSDPPFIHGMNISLSHIFKSLAKQYPQKALEQLESSSLQGNFKTSAQLSIVAGWATQDWEAAKRWIEQSSTPNKSWLMASALDELLQQDPDLALAEFSINAQELKDASFLHSNIIKHLSEDDPQKAVAWIETYPTYADHFSYRTVSSNYFLKDPNGCMDWVKSLPDTQKKDQAIESITSELKKQNIDQAIEFSLLTSKKDGSWARQMHLMILEKNAKNNGSSSQMNKEIDNLPVSDEIKAQIKNVK